MEGAVLGSSESMKREDPQDRRSRKGKDPQLSFNEPVGSIAESTPTLKTENKMLVSYPGRDQDTPLSIKGNTDVVLALNCPQLSCPMPKRRRRKLSNLLENNNLDQNLVGKGRVSFDGTGLDNTVNTGNVSKVKVHNQKVKINKSLEAASKSVEEHKELQMVQKKKRTRERKRRVDPGNKCQLGSGDSDKSMMENIPNMFDDNRSSEAALKAANEEKRVCAVQQIGKRARVGKRCTEQKNNQLESAQSSLSDTLESSNSNQNLMEKKSDPPDENKGPEAASGTADEQKEVCAVQKKKKKNRVQKRCTDQEEEWQLKIGLNNLSDTLETSNSDQKLMEKKSVPPDENQGSEAEQKVVCAVPQKEKKKRVRKRCTDQTKISNSDQNLSNILEISNSDQNLMEKKLDLSDETKVLEAASETADEQKEGCTVQQKKRRTRLVKRCIDQENKHQLAVGQSKRSNSLETSNSDHNLIEIELDASDETKGQEAASKTADEQKEVCAVRQKKRRTTVGKRRTDQGSTNQVESMSHDLSNTLVNSHPDQILCEKNSDPFNGNFLSTSIKAVSMVNHKVEGQNREVPTHKSLEALSQTETADEGEKCLVQLLKKNKVKRHATTGNNDLLESGGICVSDTINSKQLKLKKSGPQISELTLVENEKNEEVLPDNDLMAVQLRSTASCVNTDLTENQNLSNDVETPLLDVKSLQTYRRKDKRFCSMDNNLETGRDEGSVEAFVNNSNGLEDRRKIIQDDELNVVQQLVPEVKFSEEEKPRLQTNFSDSNLERLKEAGPVSDQGFSYRSTKFDSLTCPVHDGIIKRKTKTKVVGSTHQDKNLESDSRYNLCDDHLTHENESGFVSDPSAHTIRVMSEMGSPLELCKESCNSTLQDDKSHSVEESSANHPSEKSASRKRRKLEKIGHNSHKVKTSDDLLNLHPSVTQTSPSGGGSSIAFLDECQREEIAPSSDVIKDNRLAGTDIKENQFPKRPASPERASIGHTRRKLLILDLNGLLVDIVSVLPKGYTADKRIARKALLRRPFCDDFLKFCFERFNVGVWSSRTKKNVDSVVDYIMGDMRHKLLFCWHQSHCTKTGFNTVENGNKPIVFKELKKLWDKHEPKLPWEKGEYKESNTLLLDDSPYKGLLNPQYTAIFPYSYEFQNKNDNSLGPSGDLRVYLERLAAAENVQKFIEQNPFGQRAITSNNPSWLYYLKIVNANKFCLPT